MGGLLIGLPNLECSRPWRAWLVSSGLGPFVSLLVVGRSCFPPCGACAVLSLQGSPSIPSIFRSPVVCTASWCLLAFLVLCYLGLLHGSRMSLCAVIPFSMFK